MSGADDCLHRQGLHKQKTLTWKLPGKTASNNCFIVLAMVQDGTGTLSTPHILYLCCCDQVWICLTTRAHLSGTKADQSTIRSEPKSNRQCFIKIQRWHVDSAQLCLGGCGAQSDGRRSWCPEVVRTCQSIIYACSILPLALNLQSCVFSSCRRLHTKRFVVVPCFLHLPAS